MSPELCDHDARGSWMQPACVSNEQSFLKLYNTTAANFNKLLATTFLSPLAEQSIAAPAAQKVVAGRDGELQCTSGIPGSETTLRNPQNEVLASVTLQQVSLEDQGRYECSVIALGEGGNEIYTTYIDVQVIGKNINFWA